MGIGTSLGGYFEDDHQYNAAQWDPKYDPNEYDANDVATKIQGQSAKVTTIADKPDYDYDSWQKANPGVEMAPGQHYPDTYKLPNHMTFSNESMYNGKDGTSGGQWGTDDQGRDTFTPGRTNLENHSMNELKDYFQRVEPNAVLNLPNIEDVPKHDWVENVVKGMFGGAKDAVMGAPAAIKDTAEGAVKAMALPGDVLSGKVQPGSTQEIERAADLAGLMVTGPAPVASRLADGTLGSFMGVKSKTFNRDALAEAHEMTANGVHPDEVWDKTGTFAGWDSRWRQEIPDEGMKLKNENLNVDNTRLDRPTVELNRPDKDFFGTNKKTTFLDDIVDHPELYKAYPELKNIKVEPVPGFNWGVQGAYSQERNTLYINKDNPERFKDTIMHEVQHAIQGIEGFEQGGNSKQFASKNWQDLSKEFDSFKNNAEKNLIGEDKTFKQRTEYLDAKRAVKLSLDKEEGTLPKYMERTYTDKYKPIVDELSKTPAYEDLSKIVKGQHLVDTYNQKLFDSYQSIAGEVESRNVEARRKMDVYTRKIASPQSTEDHSRQEQIKSLLK